MENERFSVALFYSNETWDYLLQGVSVNDAFNSWKSVIKSPAANMGITTRAIITDSNDLCCADWQWGKGIVFPTPEDCAKMEQEKSA